MTIDGVRLFLSSKTYEIHVNASITFEDPGGISIHVMVATSEGCTFCCFLCIGIEIESY